MNTNDKDKRRRLSLGDMHVSSTRIPKELWQWADEQARAAGQTFNAWLVARLGEMRDAEGKGGKKK